MIFGYFFMCYCVQQSQIWHKHIMNASFLDFQPMILILKDCNWTRTQNHLVRKWTLNHLAKLAKRSSCVWSTYSQMHRTDKHSEHSSIISPVWRNGWVFVYELSGSGFESSCSHLNFRFRVCFEQGVPWHSGNYRVWMHSENRTWHDKNIQSYAPFR